jgi:hypothetical protein
MRTAASDLYELSLQNRIIRNVPQLLTHSPPGGEECDELV